MAIKNDYVLHEFDFHPQISILIPGSVSFIGTSARTAWMLWQGSEMVARPPAVLVVQSLLTLVDCGVFMAS